MQQIALGAVLISLLAGSGADAHGLFRRCRTCQASTGGKAPGKQTQPPASERIAPPAAPLTLNIASSGLEAEVQKRVKDWAGKGIKPQTSSTETATKSIKVIIDIDGQKFEGTLTLKGAGGKEPVVIVPGDLTKTLQSAFDGDAVVAPADKGKVKENLFIACKRLAASMDGSGPLKLTSDTIEGVRLLKNAEFNNAAGAKNLPQTRAAIDQHLSTFLPKGDKTALTPQSRKTLAAEFEKIAQALSAVK